ncbi:MAG TPA: spore germination protein [Sphingobacteriaceae bacterium]|nr:spore germination protein [Sphingobacteriaceae bacterium]
MASTEGIVANRGIEPPPAIAADQARSLLQQIDQVLVELPAGGAQWDVHMIRFLHTTLDSDDLHVDQLPGHPGQLPLTAVYLKPLVETDRIIQDVYQPLYQGAMTFAAAGNKSGIPVDRRTWLEHGQFTSDPQEIVKDLLTGAVVLLARGKDDAYIVREMAMPTRQVGEPTTEVALLAPKEGFVESAEVNLALIRRRLATEKLRVKNFKVGRISKTRVCVLYLDGLTDPSIVRKICRGIEGMDVDYVRGANDIEEILVGATMTPFPLGERTERTDRVVTALVEGRVGILVDGTPFTLVLPTTLPELQRDSEVFIAGSVSSTWVHLLRFAGLMLGTFAPAAYVALLGVSPEVLPPDLVVNVAVSRSGVPYSVLFEMLLFNFVLDVVIEATQQAPSSIGQTLTIVGSLIIGQAAVQAQLASQLVVVVLAITAIGTLLAVNLPFSYAVRIIKYPITITSGVLGLYGVALSILGVCIHVASLKSLGTPYMTAVAPLHWREFVTYHVWTKGKSQRQVRPTTFHPQDPVRMAKGGMDS